MNRTEDPGQFPDNRDLHAHRRLLLFATGVGSYLLALLLSRIPTFTEVIYGTSIGPALARVLSLATGLVPVAVGEWLIVAFLLRQLIGATVAMRDVARKRRQVGNAIRAGALRLAQDLGVVITLFYVLWGFHYSRSTLENRLDWSLPTKIDITELVDLTTQMVDAANEEYRQIHGADDAGNPTALPADRRPIEDAVVTGWVRARQALGLPELGGRFGRAKTPFLTPLYERFGVAGYYFPFTAEANLRAGIPAVDQVKMLAHEIAHQRGVAREAEANFWGFLACAHASDPQTRYSAFVFAQRQLMAALMREDTEALVDLLKRRLPGVQRDIDDARGYWERFRGHGTEIGTRVNDAFLRSNRVAGGVQNYSRSALLFVVYARQQGGTLKPET